MTLASFCAAPVALAQDAPQFNRDVRPILSQNCFPCHGPDAHTRKADLRLDMRESALEHKAIVPGDVSASELVARVSSIDAAEQMPPPQSNLHLTQEQVETLRAWVASGAAYESHWAFIAPVAAPVPEGAHLVDHFVGQRLQAEGVTPAPKADRETLLRRVTLDLTGLPPTLAEMDAFLADTAPEAYDRVVDRLLAAPAYGERMATEWLDVARYADTYGYQADRPNGVWPWRDWVIRAFNDNLPYDQFITWQVAGDLLPEATQDQVLATAFNRLHRQTNEGGSVLEEMRQEYIADRVRTFGTAFLGLTMECARCHDHKFDPITQRDYFSMGAFFGNIDESGMYPHFTSAVPSPTVLLYEGDQRAQHEALKAAVAQAEANLEATRTDLAARCAAWLADPAHAAPAATPVAHLPLDVVLEGKTPVATGVGEAVLTGDPVLAPGKLGQAMQFTGDNQVELKDVPAAVFSRATPFTVAAWVNTPALAPHEVVLHYSKAREDAGSRGWQLLLQDGKPTFGLVHFWPGNAVQVQAVAPVTAGAWTHLCVTYDGSSRAAGLRMFVDGVPVETTVVRDGLFKDFAYESDAPPVLTLAARFRDSGFKDGLIDEVYLFDRALSGAEVAAVAWQTDLAAFVAASVTDPAPEAALLEYFAAAIDTVTAEARAALLEARKAENAFVQSILEVMAMREMDTPRQAYVLARGAYDAPTDPVSPDTPAAVFAFGEGRPQNRLGLAQWLLDPANPLTARVAVNRYWQLFFGRGLVETQEDLGSQGAWPSHPELLDTLALWFAGNGWDVKALARLIVTSATYRQDAQPRPELSERDPHNTLLARGPSQRLSAEQLRDQALAASGLLVPVLGGPSVKPYQPDGLWEESGWDSYKQDRGDALYRRSMYTFAKRTVPPPVMLTFDAPSREFCIARREVTQTPLQALVLLNEPGFVEAARVLAARVARETPETGAQLTRVFRMLTGRHPLEAEQALLQQAYDEQHAWFATRADEAKAYVSAGESPAESTLDPVAHAALTAVVQAIMNHEDAQVKS
jgi:hypothetical protein